MDRNGSETLLEGNGPVKCVLNKKNRGSGEKKYFLNQGSGCRYNGYSNVPNNRSGLNLGVPGWCWEAFSMDFEAFLMDFEAFLIDF